MTSTFLHKDTNMSKHPKFIVVIGASAGGLNALSEMARHLQKGLDAAYCIVVHLSRKGIGDFVVHSLQKVSPMPCSMAKDGDAIEKGHLYVARPNQHMLVKDDHFLLWRRTGRKSLAAIH